MQLSKETNQRLIRYALAVRRYETESQRSYGKEGILEVPASPATTREWVESRDELKNCPEPKIKRLVRAVQIERLDATQTADKVRKVVAAYYLANNELIGLGHQLNKTETPRKQRRKQRRK